MEKCHKNKIMPSETDVAAYMWTDWMDGRYPGGVMYRAAYATRWPLFKSWSHHIKCKTVFNTYLSFGRSN